VREAGPKTNVIDTITGGGVTYQGITVMNGPGTPAPPTVLQATRAERDPPAARAEGARA